MIWLALLLLGLGLADLGHSVRPVPWVPEVVAAGLTVIVGLLAGLTGGRSLVTVLVIALLVLGWGRVVRLGLGSGRSWIPLLYFGVSVSAALAASVYEVSGGGTIGHWLQRTAWSLPADLAPDRALLLVGALLVQLSTGNVLVRLVLRATSTVDQIRDPSRIIKGGRLLGPMERLIILGLGLAGHLGAAGFVVAAKGLLRFPELQARRGGAEIDDITEYFLVGSFVSWMIPLVTLVLVAT